MPRGVAAPLSGHQRDGQAAPNAMSTIVANFQRRQEYLDSALIFTLK
jgi:hypothetical protein